MLMLMDRYILKKLVDLLLVGLVIFTLLLFFTDALFDFMKDLQHYGISWDIALTLMGLQVPRIVAKIIPISALLAAFLVYNTMNNEFELISMRMSGISLYRLVRPAIGVAVVCAIAAFILHDYVAPTCNAYARALKTYAVNQQNLPDVKNNFTYKQFDANQQVKRVIYISHFDGTHLGYITLIDLTNPKTLQVIQAKEGEWGHGYLTLRDESTYTVASTQKLLNFTHGNFLNLANYMHPQVEVNPNRLLEYSFLQLWQYLKGQERLGQKTSPANYVTLWNKLMEPLSALPLVLIAIPLAIISPRKLNNFGFLFSIGIWFFYYVLCGFLNEAGNTGKIPPLLATTLPILIILAIAGTLFYRKNRVL